MPLTPRSRVYEDKLARTRKKYESRNAFASERSRKAQEQDSMPASGINANLRGANFMQEGGAGKAVEAYLDWDTLKSAAQQPMSTAKGFGKLALLSMGPGAAAGVLGPKEALAAMLMQDSDVNKASAVTGILPMGSIQRAGARGAGKAIKALNEEEYVKDIFDLKHPLEDKAFVEGFETQKAVSDISPEEARILGAVDDLVSRTKQQAKEQGIKISDVSPWMRTYSHALSPKDKNALYRLFEPSDVGMDFRVSAKSKPNVDEIKQAMYRTMVGGAQRQESYGQTAQMPYSSWQDIPDEDASNIIDQMVGNWKIFDSEGRLVSGESVQLDHIVDLILGGKNTELQPMRARANASKGAKAKEKAKKNR